MEGDFEGFSPKKKKMLVLILHKINKFFDMILKKNEQTKKGQEKTNNSISRNSKNWHVN